MVLEAEQRRGVAVGLEPDVASTTAIAAVRPAFGNMGLPPKRDAPRPTIPSLDVKLSLVDES
jgi:hypothetical protein